MTSTYNLAGIYTSFSLVLCPILQSIDWQHEQVFSDSGMSTTTRSRGKSSGSFGRPRRFVSDEVFSAFEASSFGLSGASSSPVVSA
nr:hypothetical protein [Vibrio crassostreae]